MSLALDPVLPRPAIDDLLGWYRASGRDLPWRRLRDPYAIWVSEIMLQQTTVAAVIPRWQSFLRRFPDVAALAAAEETDVLAEVQGLGYYRRFRSLHQAARELAASRAGRLPAEPEQLAALPGIGAYTAGAIASIAFDRRAAAIDGNAERVLARLLGMEEIAASASARRRLGRAVETAMRDGEAADLNQAIFDLGAGPCAPRRPACGACPVATHCIARRAGDPERFSLRAPRATAVDRVVAVAHVRRGAATLVHRRPDEGRMAGFWELPELWLDPHQDAASAIVRHLAASTGLSIQPIEIARARHTITRHRLDCRLFGEAGETVAPPSAARAAPALPDDHAWIDLDATPLPISTISRKLMRALRRRDGARDRAGIAEHRERRR